MLSQRGADDPMAPASRAAVAAEQIAAMIMNGDLRDGERLVEEELAGRLGMSRLPVREALRMLAQEGLVTVLPRRGAFVTHFGPREMIDVYDVRAELLGFAARLVASSIEEARLAELEAILVKMRQAVAAGDVDAYVQHHQRLRRIVWESTPNSLLRDLIWQVWRRGVRLRVIALHLPGRMARSLHVHEELVRAFRQRDSTYAERLIWVLSQDAKQALLDQYFGDQADSADRIEPTLPDLSALTLPRASDEPRQRSHAARRP
jgi:DNA-binding GntR family transcriptional regulator